MPDAEPIVIQRDLNAAVFSTLPPSRQPQNLIDGLVYIAPPPGEDHEEVEFLLGAALREFAREHGGRVLVRPYACEMSDTTVVVPDIGYVVPARTNLAGSYLRGAPDIAIEVVTPGTRAFDTEAKFAAYGAGGVREAWFVDIERRLVTVVRGDGSAWRSETTIAFGETIPSEICTLGDGGLSGFELSET